jgi:DNA excision repair protein ERCC-8
MQFDITINSEPQLIYMPSEGNILIYELQTGIKVNTLLGHYNSVNSCICHPFYHELYTAGNDRNVLIWAADYCQTAAYDEHLKSLNVKKGPFKRRGLFVQRNVTGDTWSSDEEG